MLVLSYLGCGTQPSRGFSSGSAGCDLRSDRHFSHNDALKPCVPKRDEGNEARDDARVASSYHSRYSGKIASNGHTVSSDDMTKGKDGDHSVDLLESDSDTDSSNGSNNEKHDDIVDDDETIVPTLSSAFALRNHHTSGADNQSAAAAAASALPTKKRHRPYHHSNSPATQTLDALALSQQSADLNYDLSQLEYDLVAALVQTKKTRVLPCDEDENDENNTTDEPAKQRTSNDTVSNPNSVEI